MDAGDRAFIFQVLRYAAALSSMFMGYGLIQPLLSLYTSSFVGASYLLVGALVSTIGLVKAGMGPVSGFMSDRYGRKRMATLGALSVSLSILIVTLAQTAPHLVAAFVLYGLGQAFFFLAIMTGMVEAAGPARRALVLGLYEGVNSFSILAGTWLSGPLTASLGVRPVFGVAAAFSLVSFAACMFLVRETAVMGQGARLLELRGLRGILSREYVTAMYSAFLYMYTHSLYLTVIPLYTTLTVRIPDGFLPVLFMELSGTTAFGSLVAGPVSDRVGRRVPLAVGMVVAASSFVALLLSASQTVLVAASLALGLGAGFFHPVASAVVADISTVENRGKAFGFYRLTRDLGTFAGPAAAGVVTSLLGVEALFTLSAGLMAVGAFLALFVIRETHPKDSGASA
ncbi:MAG TPA: MFS transporter [Candidatus Desulfaltia sp.]|nr:MFS transporter [Candidatus Desulfaltia sp.]